MEEQKKSKLTILTNGIIKENPILVDEDRKGVV